MNLIAPSCAAAAAIWLMPIPIDEPLIPRSSIEYDRQDYPCGTDVARSEHERLVPKMFWPAPPDAQTLAATMASAGPIASTEWDVFERAYLEFARTIQTLAPRFDRFEFEFPEQYFINYPSVKPPDVRQRSLALRMALIDAAEQFINELSAPGRDHPPLQAAIHDLKNYELHLLCYNRPATPLAVMPNLLTTVQQTCANPSPEAQQVLYDWRDEVIPLLKRWHRNRESGYDQWQTTLTARGLPEPPYNAEEWAAENRDATVQIYRSSMAAAHRDACELIRITSAALDRLLPILPADDARRIRFQVNQRWSSKSTPLHRIQRELKVNDLSHESAKRAVTEWDALDWNLLRESLLIAARDPEPYWPFHHRIDRMRPELQARFDDILRRREEAAAALLDQLKPFSDQGAASPKPRPVDQRQFRQPSFVPLAPPRPHPGHGGNDFAIRSAPEPLNSSWINSVEAALGPIATVLNLELLVSDVAQARQQAQHRMAHHQDQSWLFESGTGYRFDPQGSAKTRLAREESRMMIVDAERRLLDQLERFTDAAVYPARLSLYVRARRAGEHRMVEASRHKLAPRDAAAIIEPLSALVELGLNVELETEIWRDIERDAARFEQLRRAWLTDVANPILDYYDARNAAVWRRNEETAARIKAAADHVYAVHERHSQALGNAAIALAERIEVALDEEKARRFRRNIMIQVCPSVWSIEPRALRDIRDRLAAAQPDLQANALSKALEQAQRDDTAIANELTRILGAFDAAALWKSDTDLQLRILITRRADQAELHLARALALVADGEEHR